MTAKILEFTRNGKPPHHRKTDRPFKDDRPKTSVEIYDEVRSSILSGWYKAAEKGKLSNYVQNRIPSIARDKKDTDYVNDINVLSEIEQKLNIVVAVFGPTSTYINPLGWFATFTHDSIIFSTPPDMISEGHARAMNIVMYCVFMAKLKANGLFHP